MYLRISCILSFSVFLQVSPFTWMPSMEVISKYELDYGIKISKKETELNGNQRFLADNLLSTNECEDLLELMKHAEGGSGYSGDTSPHTEREFFKGLTIQRLAELTSEGNIPLRTAKLFLDKTELARTFLQSYFNLTNLYFDYTHFVCRSVKNEFDGVTPPPGDLSHAIHGDNCVFLDGHCERRPPAFTWRDYSAILYINQDIDGGEFIFTDTEKNITAEVRPQCGRMVGFSAETLHGVKSLTRGTRCALAMWMTMDPSHNEVPRIEAEEELEALEDKETVQNSLEKPSFPSEEL